MLVIKIGPPFPNHPGLFFAIPTSSLVQSPPFQKSGWLAHLLTPFFSQLSRCVPSWPVKEPNDRLVRLRHTAVEAVSYKRSNSPIFHAASNPPCLQSPRQPSERLILHQHLHVTIPSRFIPIIPFVPVSSVCT